MRVLLFGDSIAFGRNDMLTGGWGHLLGHFLDVLGGKNNFFNLSAPFETSEKLLKRMEFECSSRIGDKPKEEVTIIIAIGINDSSLEIGSRLPRVNKENYLENMERIFTIARSWADRIVVIGLTPVDRLRTEPFLDKCIYDGTVEVYNHLLESLCASQGVEFLSLIDNDLIRDNLADGLHPTTAGHLEIARLVMPLFSQTGPSGDKLPL